MLLTTLNHADALLNRGNFPDALAWLHDHADGAGLASGRHPIDGDRLFAIVEDKTAHEVENASLVWETHRRYADIQYVARGVESQGWLSTDHAPPHAGPGDDAKDYQFYEAPGPAHRPAWFDVPAGHLTVFYPSDVHAPSQPPLHGPAQAVVKIIVKVRLD